VINLENDFIGGLLVGASCACLIVGTVQWFYSRRLSLGPDPLSPKRVVTKIEHRILNGIGLTCAVSQGAVTLLFGLMLAQDEMHRDFLPLIIAWFTATLMLGVMVIVGGYRSETTIYRYDSPVESQQQKSERDSH
jgi:hypothetical protein